MKRIEDHRLRIPPVMEHDWDRAVAEVDDAEQPLVQTQRELVAVLSRMDTSRTTPAALAWLMIWSRLFACCEGARGAWNSGSVVALHMVDRIALEAFLQLLVLTEPDAPAGVRTRFEAYTAWAMASDIKLLRHGLLRIDALFDPVPGRNLVRQLGQYRQEWQDRFGVIDVVGDPEAERDKAEHRLSAERKIARLEEWLMDPRLTPWAERVLARQGIVTLFELFESTDRHVQALMQRRGIGHLYFSYMAGSGTIHGSSFQAFMWHGETDLMPMIGAFTDRMAGEVLEIAEQIRLAAPMLDLTRKYL